MLHTTSNNVSDMNTVTIIQNRQIEQYLIQFLADVFFFLLVSSREYLLGIRRLVGSERVNGELQFHCLAVISRPTERTEVHLSCKGSCDETQLASSDLPQIFRDLLKTSS